MLRDVSDLLEDGGVYSLEKALLRLFDAEIGVANFVGCDLEHCTEASKLGVLKRVECIRAIHNIRGILAKQCYIGVVGVQDAGMQKIKKTFNARSIIAPS